MKFFKENSYDIVRLFINQIGITIFSFFLYTAVGNFFSDPENRTHFELFILIAISVLATLFYFVLVYTVCWDYGAKDKIRIDGKRMECDKYKALKMAIIANTINFILAVLSSVFRGIYMLGGAEGLGITSSTLHVILQFIASMYHGILQGICHPFIENDNLYYLGQEIGYAIIPFLMVLVAHIGYTFGLKDKKIFKSVAKTK